MHRQRFRAMLAHCNVGPWGRTPEGALRKCDELLACELTADQVRAVQQRQAAVRGVRAAVQKCPEPQGATKIQTTVPTTLGTGVHALTPRSVLVIERAALRVSPAQFEELRRFMADVVKPTPNPRNPKFFLNRKQCTFVDGGVPYEFGQFNETFEQPMDTWPELAQHVLRLVRERVRGNEMFGADLYNGVHVNLYPTGKVGVMPHRDNEKSLVEGAPIFSFTLLSDPMRPRDFTVYDCDNAPLYRAPLGHGDLLVMAGETNREFKHGVEPARPPAMYKDLVRINLTVRAFHPAG